MARDAELRTRLVAEDEASKVIEKVADKAEDLGDKPVEVKLDADVRGALDQLDQLNEKAHATAVAAEQLGQALGPELSGRADMHAVVAELERTGVSIEQITANAEEFGAKLKAIDSPDLGGNLGRALGTARGQAEAFNEAVGKGQSVAANAYGNMAQDIGSLAGVTGTAGVAFGQMGEYIADAFFSSGNLKAALTGVLTTAGPLAAVTVGMQLLQGAMENIKADKAFNAKVVDEFAEAIRRGSDAAQSLREEMVESGKLEFSVAKTGLLQFGTEARNIVEDLDKLGLSYEDFLRLAAEGQQLDFGEHRNEFDATDRSIIRVNDALGDYSKNAEGAEKAADALASALGYQSVDAMQAAEGWKTFNKELDNAPTDMPATFALVSDAVERMQAGLEPTSAQLSAISTLTSKYGVDAEEVYSLVVDKQEEAAEAAAELREEQEQLTAAAQDYQTIVASSDWGKAGLEGAVAGAQAFGAQQFGLTTIASNAEAAYDALGKAVEENGFTFDLNTEAGRANAEVIQGLYQSQIPGMASAFTNANGSIGKFRNGMDDLRQNVMQQLREETGLTEEQIAQVVDQMGLVPGNVSSQFEMLGTEDANAKLALLSGVLSSLPEDVQRKVTLAVLAGDPQGALDTIEEEVSNAPHPPAVVPIEGEPDPVLGTIEDVEGGDYSAEVDIEGNRRPGDRTVDAFTSEQRATDPVKVDANTVQAIRTMQLLYTLAQLLQPQVTVTADTFPARLSLASLGMMNVRVPVEGYLRDYPSNAEIAARIGVVRVPVDAYLRTTPRIAGT